MNLRSVVFKARVEAELEDLDKVVQRTLSAWRYAKEQHNDLFLDAAALNLHGFYAGVERIFEMISKEIDHSVPSGNAWHRELVYQMTMDIESIRPPVISKDLERVLDEYRGFRHVVRNAYTYNLSEDRLRTLIEGLQDGFTRLRIELGQFLALIDGN